VRFINRVKIFLYRIVNKGLEYYQWMTVLGLVPVHDTFISKKSFYARISPRFLLETEFVLCLLTKDNFTIHVSVQNGAYMPSQTIHIIDFRSSSVLNRSQTRTT